MDSKSIIPKDVESIIRNKVINIAKNKHTGEIIFTSGGTKKLLNKEEKDRLIEWIAISLMVPCVFIDERKGKGKKQWKK